MMVEESTCPRAELLRKTNHVRPCSSCKFFSPRDCDEFTLVSEDDVTESSEHLSCAPKLPCWLQAWLLCALQLTITFDGDPVFL